MLNAISPELGFVVKYKFFAFLILCLLILLLRGTRNFLKLFAYFLFFPFLFLFWQIPMLLLQKNNWILVLGYLTIIISFFKSMKLNLIVFTTLSISLTVIITQEHKYILILMMFILGIYLSWYYVRCVIASFKTPNVLGIDTTRIKELSLSLNKQYIDYKITGTNIKENMSEEEHKTYISKLEQVLFFNKMWYFVASKLRDFKNSKALLLYCFAKLFFTLCITIIIFALLNYSAYKIDHSSFATPTEIKGFLSFIYYSFNTIFTNNVVDFYPVTNFARFLNSAEIFFGFLILVILFFLTTTVLKEKHTEELDRISELAKVQGQELDKIIYSNFNLTVDDAIQEIEKIKSSMFKMIYYFTSQIDSQ